MGPFLVVSRAIEVLYIPELYYYQKYTSTYEARIGTIVESASRRCRALTHGCAFPGLASAVARALDSHLDR